MTTVAPATAAPDWSLTLPRMRPEVVWENVGTVRASVRQTMPKMRMPFNGECITTSKSQTGWKNFGRTPHDRLRSGNSKIKRFEHIALTRLTRQVVLWFDRKTALRPRVLAEVDHQAVASKQGEEISMGIATINPATGEVV